MTREGMSWPAITGYTLLAAVLCFAVSAGMNRFMFDHAIDWSGAVAAAVGGASITFLTSVLAEQRRVSRSRHGGPEG
jgi:hypothetical protein